MADGIIRAISFDYDEEFLNLGSGRETTILELIKTLSEIIDFKYKFDISKPTGFPKRLMNISLAKSKIGYEPKTSLKLGLNETWSWLKENREEYKLKRIILTRIKKKNQTRKHKINLVCRTKFRYFFWKTRNYSN